MLSDVLTHLARTTVQFPIAFAFVFILLLVTYTVFYNRVFHPLRKFPGPFLASVTPLYNVYLFASKHVHSKSVDLHQRYGPVVRAAPNLVLVANFRLLSKIYHRNVDKTPFYSTGIAGEIAPLLQIQDHREHAASLKVLAPSLSMKSIKSMERSVDERVAETMTKLRSRCNTTADCDVDISDWIRWYVYDTLCHLVYGKPAGMVRQEQDVDGLISHWHRMFWFGGLVGTLPSLVHPIITCRILKRFLMPNKSHKSGSGFIMLAHEKLFGHVGADAEKDKTIRKILAEGDALSPEQIQHQCYLSTIAGQDTTSSLLSALLDHLLAHPWAIARVLSEISACDSQQKFSTPVVQYEETSEAYLPFLNACIRETLRLTPPTPLHLPRYVPTGGIWIDEETCIPEGTEIAANPYVIAREKPLYGDDADEFRPERWLEDTERLALMHKFDFAWGFGDRRCIGKSLALIEAVKFVVQLLREFQLSSISDRPSKINNVGIYMFFDQHIKIRRKATASSEVM